MPPRAKPIALVSGLDFSGYGIMRSLAQHDVRIVALSSPRGDAAYHSRYRRGIHFYPPGLDLDRIAESLLQWRREYDHDPVLFSTSDWFAYLTVHHQAQLSSCFRFHWQDTELVRRIIHKDQMNAICREAGVLVPRTHVTRAGEPLEPALAEFPFPCLVKPFRNYGTSFPEARKNLVARSPEELIRFYGAHPELMGLTLWQEIVEGGDNNIFQCTVLVRQSGELGAVACVRKLRQYPPGYGSMCFGRTEHNEVVIAAALRLLRHLGYRGLASLEFKFRPQDGRYYFIEMNPRLPWYNGLFADAGINLAYLAYLDLIEEFGAAKPALQQREGVHWVSFYYDLRWWLSKDRQRTSFWSWLRSLGRARSFAWWNWRDPLPWLRATGSLIAAVLRKFTERQVGSCSGLV